MTLGVVAVGERGEPAREAALASKTPRLRAPFVSFSVTPSLASIHEHEGSSTDAWKGSAAMRSTRAKRRRERPWQARIAQVDRAGDSLQRLADDVSAVDLAAEDARDDIRDRLLALREAARLDMVADVPTQA